MIRGEGQTSVTTDKTFIESYKNAHKQYADYLEKKKKEEKEDFKKWQKNDIHSYLFFLKLL